MPDIQIGLTNEKSVPVVLTNTALAMGSGELKVFATPAMVALIEGCCAEAVEDLLDEGTTTVGVSVDVKHVAASPIGASILCKCRLTAIDGRRLDFDAEVYDSKGLVGKGNHTRFIVNTEKFLKKAYGN